MAAQDQVLRAACAVAGVDAVAVELIRPGGNTIYRLPGGVIARLGRLGETAAAARRGGVGRMS